MKIGSCPAQSEEDLKKYELHPFCNCVKWLWLVKGQWRVSRPFKMDITIKALELLYDII